MERGLAAAGGPGQPVSDRPLAVSDRPPAVSDRPLAVSDRPPAVSAWRRIAGPAPGTRSISGYTPPNGGTPHPPRECTVTASSRILWAWFWVAVCVAAILAMSGEAFAGMHTGRYLRPFLRWLFPEISNSQILDLHFAVRKAAHLTEYAVLAMFSLRALRLTIDVSILRIAGLTLVIVLAVAGVDELRQAHLAMRTGSVWDIVINLVGGSIGVLLVIAVHRVFGVGAPTPKGET